MTITYRDLLNKLKKLNEAQLNSDITVQIDSEFYKATMYLTDNRIDILDEGHPVIVRQTNSVPFGLTK
jgi:hypothetical protein